MMHFRESPVRLVMLAMFLTGAAFSSASLAQSIQDSRIRMRVIASNIAVESVQASSSSTKVLFFRKTRDNPALIGKVDISVVDVQGNARITGLDFESNVIASQIYSKGGEIRIGGLYIRP